MPDHITSTKKLAYCLLRIAFGVNFVGHGLIRILSGVDSFATATADHLAKSPLPHGFILAYAHAIPFIEVALGLGLIFGLLTRTALICGAIFMMGLTIGVTSIQQFETAGLQLTYSFVYFVLLYFLELNGYSLDELIKGRSSEVKELP